MKLHHLSVRNFRSFAELELPLNVEGLIAVVGPNGAGKTSIFQAIEWALYGSPPGRGLPVRRDGSEGACEVTVEFEIGGRAYAVHRVDGRSATIRDASDPTAEPLANTRAETTKYVAGLLGLTREMFRGTFYARQREVQALDADDAARRRQQVELLLGIERLRLAHGHALTAAKAQKHVVDTLAAAAPDVGELTAELDRIRQREADGAPAVQAAERQLAELTEQHKQAETAYQQLRDRERLASERRTDAERARGLVGQHQVAFEQLTAQVQRGQAASVELAELEPVAADAALVAAREQELRDLRAKHQHAADLRRKRDEALREAARVADQIGQLVIASSSRAPVSAGSSSALSVADGEDRADDFAQQVSDAERRLSEAAAAIRTLTGQVADAERRAGEAEQLIARAEQAHNLDRQLAQLPAAEAAVEESLEQWQQLSARQRQLTDAIAHDTEHRDAVLAGTTQAKCPTCQRDFGSGERDRIVAEFDQALELARVEVGELAGHLAELKRAGQAQRATVKQLHGMAADRRALGTVPAEDELEGVREQAAASGRQAGGLSEQLQQLDANSTEIERSLPHLRELRDDAERQRRQREELDAERRRYDDLAEVLAGELERIDVDRYDADEHARVSARLVSVQEARQRCAMLRGQVDGLDLLQRRLYEAQQVLEDAKEAAVRCEQALAEVAIDPGDVLASELLRDQLTEQIRAADVAFFEARQQIAAHSEAVGAAQARLADGRKQVDQLRSERRELDLRQEVAAALSAFREEASRRARPTLAQKSSLLLAQTTRGRYSAVQLTDSYQLEIIDRDRIYPLKRFSGGEQDLASLCLRVALSQTLADQRGAETGFVLLDEVFGSQDGDRRSALLEQLKSLAESHFRQVFVISHTDDVVRHCDLRIDVSRDDRGVSTAAGPRS